MGTLDSDIIIYLGRQFLVGAFADNHDNWEEKKKICLPLRISKQLCLS